MSGLQTLSSSGRWVDLPGITVTGLLPPAANEQSHKPPHIHVGTGPCELRHCGWSGFHLHWRHRRYRSFREVPADLVDELDADLTASLHPGWGSGG